MKLFLKIPNQSKRVGFRDPQKNGVINKGYELQHTVCDVDIPVKEAELILAQNPHLVSEKPGDVMESIKEAQARRVAEAHKVLAEAGLAAGDLTVDGAIAFLEANGYEVIQTREPEPVKGRQKSVEEMSKKELQAYCEERGIAFTDRESKDILIERLAAKELEGGAA